ncbi:MAG: DUF4270 domain-containing protein [Flavobacteriales bacterium]|nr:DUF4270 domain-containing protein [Flavobacteriales bacterium]MBK7269779.1 DUF4270 domain-containing protein [Flavobacteriales bacterium]MBK9538121.1 DUF4270 domain-containing protein [Flavobacteriales bacterium]
MYGPARSGALLLWGAALLLSSCKKPEDGLGLDILDPADTLGLAVTDTATVLAWTAREPSLRTNNLSRLLVGSYVDARFGPVKASTITQVRLSTNNVGAGQNNDFLVIDSVVLALQFDPSLSHYGDLSAQRFQVFELGESLSADSSYRTDRAPVLQGEDLMRDHGSLITPRPDEAVVIGGDTLLPQLRLSLDPALGQRILDAFGTADLADNTAFLSFFKGVYITVDEQGQLPFQGGVLYFNMPASASKMTLYYRDLAVPGEEDTLAFDMPINENCVRYTRSELDHQGALDPALPQALADTALNQGTYVQALGGLRTRLVMPHLSTFSAADLQALAKAELVVPIDGVWPEGTPPPTNLFVFRKNEDGEDLFLPDQLDNGLAIGGEFDADAGEYRFAITRYMQNVLNGTYANSGLSLVSGNSGISVNRAALAGPQDPQGGLRLVLTFTTY